MKYAFFRVPVLNTEEAIASLNQFCTQHKIYTTDKAFVSQGDNSYWSFCLTYEVGSVRVNESKKGKVDYKEVLSDSDFQIFARLREFRKVHAEAEGVPAYALFTNEQLANMVRQRITTLSALANIEGVGAAKIEKYGKAFIDLLTQCLTETRTNQEPVINETTKPTFA